MNRKFILAAMLPVMAMAVSCAKQESPSVPSGGALLTISPTSCVTTKSAIDGTVFPDWGTFILSASVSDGGGNFLDGTTFVKNGDVWTADKYWPIQGGLDLLALSCDSLGTVNPVYADRWSDSMTVAIPDNSSVQSDVMHASAQGQSYSASGVPMSFRHAQTLLIFTAGSTVPYDASANKGVSIRTITLKDAYYGGSLKVRAVSATGDYCTWSSLGSQKTSRTLLNLSGSDMLNYGVPATPMDITQTGNHFGIGGKGIMVPEQKQTSFEVAYTLHYGRDRSGNPVDMESSYTYVSTGDWDEGKKLNYKINFNISLNEITVVPTVVDWSVEEEDVPFPEPVAATYDVSGATSVSLPAGVMAENSVISVDWGDGSKEAFTNVTKASVLSGDTLKLSHTYASAFTGKVKLNARKGSVNFVKVWRFSPFTIFDNTKIIVSYVDVGIKHINGNIYTASEWTAYGFVAADALGVAVTDGTRKWLLHKAEGSAKWSDSQASVSGASSRWGGKANTDAIIAAKSTISGFNCPAADWCRSAGAEWYFPAMDELFAIDSKQGEVNGCLTLIGGTKLNSNGIWSSTQVTGQHARYRDAWGREGTTYKSEWLAVRRVSAL